ncbi:MAG: glycosyltransferase [Thermodesulfobacteriota bacterium]
MILVFTFALTGTLAVFLLYPLILLLTPGARPDNGRAPSPLPSLSLIVVHREAGPLLPEKIADCLRLHYPAGQLEIIFFADGPCSYPVGLPAAAGSGVRLLLTGSDEILGKNEALNRAAALATNEILVLSDVDAVLDPEALVQLSGHFADTGIGGVCGRRHIRDDDRTGLHHGQEGYIGLDSLLKRLESRQGFLTSNDGKIYAVRRRLFPHLPDGVTDDLFVCLAVIAAGSLFRFDPRVTAYIRSPSRSVAHEWRRRRRIVCCSLRGISLQRHLCNPRRYGLFAIGLLINKVLRRLLLPLLVLLLFCSNRLAPSHPFFLVAYLGQMTFYCFALLYPLSIPPLTLPRFLNKGAQWSCYFLVGNLASFAGVVDFLRGRKVTGWRPEKR